MQNYLIQLASAGGIVLVALFLIARLYEKTLEKKRLNPFHIGAFLVIVAFLGTIAVRSDSNRGQTSSRQTKANEPAMAEPVFGHKPQSLEIEANEVTTSTLYRVWLQRSGLLGRGKPDIDVTNDLSEFSPAWQKVVRLYAKARTETDYREILSLLNERSLLPPDETEPIVLRAAINMETGIVAGAAEGFTIASSRCEGESIQSYFQAAAANAHLGQFNADDAYDLACKAEAGLPTCVSHRICISFTKATADFMRSNSKDSADGLIAAYDDLKKANNVDQRTLVTTSYSAAAALCNAKLFDVAEKMAAVNIEKAKQLADSAIILARLKQIRGNALFELGTSANTGPSRRSDYLKLAQTESREAFTILKDQSSAKSAAANAFIQYAHVTLTLKDTARYESERSQEFDPFFKGFSASLSADDVLFGLVRSMNSKYLRTKGDLLGSRRESLAAIEIFDKSQGGKRYVDGERLVVGILDERIAAYKSQKA